MELPEYLIKEIKEAAKPIDYGKIVITLTGERPVLIETTKAKQVEIKKAQ